MSRKYCIKFVAAFLSIAVFFLFSSCVLLIDDAAPVESYVPQSVAKAALEKPAVQAEYPLPCFHGASGDEYPLRPIENQEDERVEKVRTDSETELLNIVMKFRRPRFIVNSTLRPVYNAAIETLNAIISEEMTDLEKVHAIYDFLVYYVDYDWELYEMYKEDSNQVFGDENAFKLEGVFVDKKAVCDGISKAFSLMCSIECIPNVRIVGDKDGIPHAWNKVRLDGKWYLVDATWGNHAIRASSGEAAVEEYLTHAYLLIADDSSYEEKKIYSGNLYTLEQVRSQEDYDFYQKTNMPGFTLADNPHNYVIDSETEQIAFLTFLTVNQLPAAEFYCEDQQILLPGYHVYPLNKNAKLAIFIQ